MSRCLTVNAGGCDAVSVALLCSEGGASAASVLGLQTPQFAQ